VLLDELPAPAGAPAGAVVVEAKASGALRLMQATCSRRVLAVPTNALAAFRCACPDLQPRAYHARPPCLQAQARAWRLVRAWAPPPVWRRPPGSLSWPNGAAAALAPCLQGARHPVCSWRAWWRLGALLRRTVSGEPRLACSTTAGLAWRPLHAAARSCQPTHCATKRAQLQRTCVTHA